MERIKYPDDVNKNLFNSNSGITIAKYGLPKDIRFCKRCVISNQRPNSTVEYLNTSNEDKATIHFNIEGVCDACIFAERKRTEIDWAEREQRLIELCNKHRKNDGSYDCIVPGSGGKDSFFASHVLKHKYGMHPLTVTWAPHVYTEWGWRNFQKWIHAGHDNVLVTPNGQVHRLLTRLSTELLFHPFQAFMIGQKALAPKMAALHGISLVFYGENEAEYGNALSDTDSATRDNSFFSNNEGKESYLGGVSISSLINEFGLEKNDLNPYMPIDQFELESKNIEVHYLGYYVKWHPQGCYYYAVENGGFEASPERTPGTYSKYNSIDDRIDDFHYYTTGIKFGIGRATYDAAQEIRSGDINRDEGIALVKRFDHEFPERFAEEMFAYLSLPAKDFPKASQMFEQPKMNREYFDHLTDTFRSPHLWKLNGDKWELRNAVWHNEH